MMGLEPLLGIDLKVASKEDVERHVRGIGPWCYFITIVEPGRNIHRARPLDFPLGDLTQRSQLSSPPSIGSISRAAMPPQPVFYGVLEPYDLDSKVHTDTRLTSVLESKPELLDPEQVVKPTTFGVGTWKVQGQLELVTIIDESKSYSSKYLQSIQMNYRSFLEEDHSIRQQHEQLNKFLESHFSRLVVPSESYLYNLTATFSKLLMDRYDGVLYPSVQTEGLGMCVALRASSENKLSLFKVDAMQVTKITSKPEITYLASASVHDETHPFKLKDIDRTKS